MAFREVRVFEVREVLRLWLAGDGFRAVERRSQVDRKTVRRYVEAAVAVGLDRGGGGEPGDELQVDFGRMGTLFDPDTGRNRVVWALLFTACYSRHQFVWLSFRQTTEAVIEGFEAAWAFFVGVFRTAIPDNMGAIV